MANFNCFSVLCGRKKKDKRDKKSSEAFDYEGPKTLQGKIEHTVNSDETDELKSTSFSLPVPFGIPGSSRSNVKVMSHESPVGNEVEEVAYEGEDEQDESVSMKKDCSDTDLKAQVGFSNEENDHSINFYHSAETEISDLFEKQTEKDAEQGIDKIRSGHISDPGNKKAEFWASPELKRSCSNLETGDVLKKIADRLPFLKSQSFEDLQMLAGHARKEIIPENFSSPASVMTHCSADKVMLKKQSSSQILPSRSRRLWWKLFLWSHRNLHRVTVKPQSLPTKSAFNQPGGYSSDTLELNRGMELNELGMGSPSSFTTHSFNKANNNQINHSWEGFQSRTSGMWPQNHWAAFPAELSTLTRVDEWVNELASQPPLPVDNEDNADDGIVFPPSPDSGKSPARGSSHLNRHPQMNLSEEILHANSVIQSLSHSSTVAHISGIGLRVVPVISCYSSLRSVNLSGNFIYHIAPGSLPKSLHTLNLSRNKIHTIEGLRELSHLRVLDLSYNRIFQIGQGLSNCTLIKELYLAGNKMSDVEGLHRLLKLTVLDLSFNKITTAKALGQLVANYNSLLALNLLGNPIQSNISDDKLRKAVCGLLPKLAYLNKQPLNPQRAREVATETIAKAALGNSGWSARTKAVKRGSQGGSSASSVHRSNASVAQKSRHRLKSRTHDYSSLKTKSSAFASSSH